MKSNDDTEEECIGPCVSGKGPSFFLTTRVSDEGDETRGVLVTGTGPDFQRRFAGSGFKFDQLKRSGIKECREVGDSENRACEISLARLSPRLLRRREFTRHSFVVGSLVSG